VSKTEKVICDQCEKDISYRDNTMEYRILLKSEEMPLYATVEAFNMVYIKPAISETMHFCSITCLNKLLNEKFKD